MDRRGQGQVEARGAVRSALRRAGLADSDHRQAARTAGGLETLSQAGDLVREAGRVDDSGLDAEIRQGRDGAVRRAGGDRAPAQAVQPLGQGPGHAVVARKNQDAGVKRQGTSQSKTKDLGARVGALHDDRAGPRPRRHCG
jgi:hypothetical protein